MKWWRWLFGGRDWPDPPERLIDIPESREPSPSLLLRLRQMDLRAEVVYVGNGVWWVGRVKPESPRRISARRQILSLREPDGFPDTERLPELRQARLQEQGFGLVVRKRIQGEPDDMLVAEFRKAMYVERGGEIDNDEKKLARARIGRQRDTAQWERDKTHELFFRGRGNFHFPARTLNTAR